MGGCFRLSQTHTACCRYDASLLHLRPYQHLAKVEGAKATEPVFLHMG